MEQNLDNSVPWNWDAVQLPHHFNGMPNEWCNNQNWVHGVDYYFIITDPNPMYTTEWGRFNLNSKRIYLFLFKDPKNATIFRLRWA